MPHLGPTCPSRPPVRRPGRAWVTGLTLVWLALVLLPLAAGCGGASGLRYQLKPGDQVRYRYTETNIMQVPVQVESPVVLPERIDLRYNLTASVVADQGDTIVLKVAVSGVEGQVTDRNGTQPLSGPPEQTANLLMRPGTGQLLAVEGEITLPVAGTQFNLLDSFRQALHSYPEQPVKSGDRWPAMVHHELARNLTDSFQATVTYAGDSERDGVPVAWLKVVGEGIMPDDGGQLTLTSTLLVDRNTGLPVHSEDVARLDSPVLIMESRSTLTRVP